MASATILHFGKDLCYRILLLEQFGVSAVRMECSPHALQAAFAGGKSYDGVAFHNDLCPGLSAVVTFAQKLTPAPLILFQNSLADCDESLFDLVIPVQTPPAVWIKSLAETIHNPRLLREASERLPQEYERVRAVSRRLQQIPVRSRAVRTDRDEFWRGSQRPR